MNTKTLWASLNDHIVACVWYEIIYEIDPRKKNSKSNHPIIQLLTQNFAKQDKIFQMQI
jgi:hypothetical protein